MTLSSYDLYAHDAVTPSDPACPRCGDLSPRFSTRCESCDTWLLMRGPTASELRERALRLLRYPPPHKEKGNQP